MDNNFENTPETQNDVNFNTDEKITVVETKPENTNKKMPIIIMICILVIALVAGIVIYAVNSEPEEPTTTLPFTEEATSEDDPLGDFLNSAIQEVITDENGNEISREEYKTQLQQQIQEATTILNQYVGSTSPHQIVENTTSAPSNSGGTQTETTTANNQQNEKAEAQIKAFFERTFYIQGAFYTGNSGEPLYMSMDGGNFEMLTNLGGTEVSMLRLDNVMYLKRPALNQYVELTEAFFDAMGIDPESLNFNLGDATFETMKSKLYSVHDVTINGNAGVCYEYRADDQSFKFFAENGDLRQIEIYDEAGNIDAQFTIDYFSASIPGDQLTLKGYEKTGMGTLFADLM